MAYRFSHVAVTVPVEQLAGVAREELLEFYREVFGWRENPGLAIPGRRIFLRAPTDTQYITIRASQAPMRTSGYEHLGIIADSEAELRMIHERAAAMASRFLDMELHPIQSEYGGTLLTFRVRFRLPLTLEIQHLRMEAR
jgi:4-hydroxyphenylpyruvate dioxygenase-like putative hemolysin